MSNNVPINPPLKLRTKHPRHMIVPVEKFADDDGLPKVRVPLYGAGAGYSMVLDEADWLDVRKRGWPAASRVLKSATANRPGFVITSCQPISCGKRPVLLARFLLSAQPGELVTYRNGDEFDLTRQNLEKISPKTAAQRWHGHYEIADSDNGVPW